LALPKTNLDAMSSMPGKKIGAIVFLPLFRSPIVILPLFFNFVILPLRFQSEEAVYPYPLCDVNGVKYDAKR
jgi:hypothetical protein